MSKKQTNDNGIRYALVPHPGCVCEQCLRIASFGFHYLDTGWSPHGGKNINCKCQFMPGVDGKTKISGYEPKKCEELSNTLKSARETLGMNELELKIALEDSGAIDASLITIDGIQMAVERILLAREYPEAYGCYAEYVKSADLSKIRYDKQMQHVYGSSQYLREFDRGETKSCFVGLDYDGIIGLISRYAGKGIPVFSGPDAWCKLEIVYTDEVIGYTLNSDGEEELTKAFTIRYSNKGLHAVPKHDDRLTK